MEPRLIDLELKYMQLERQVAELSQVVFEQQKSIDYLRKELLATRGRVEALGDPLTNEPPPHY